VSRPLPPIGVVTLTPPITEGYWRVHVQVTDAEAIVGFREGESFLISALHPPLPGSGSWAVGERGADWTLPDVDVLTTIGPDLTYVGVDDTQYLTAINLVQGQIGLIVDPPHPEQHDE
jgi:hypothetical protein